MSLVELTDVEELIQGTDEWLLKRCGKMTASRIADLMATGRGGKGRGVTALNYRAELVAERLTGEPAPHFKSTAMQWGTDTEPLARSAYELYHHDVVEIGFVDHPSIPNAGCSPDGLVGGVGLVEFKCPNTATHIKYLLADVVPAEYIKQMQWQMDCTGRTWCDFVSYDPRLPERHKMFIKRLDRDHALCADIRFAVAEFDEEIEKIISDMESIVAKK